MTDDPSAYLRSNCARHCSFHQEVIPWSHPESATHGQTAQAHDHLLRQAGSDDDLTKIQTCLQRQRSPGQDDFRTMVGAKGRRFASLPLAHRQPRDFQTVASAPGPVSDQAASQPRDQWTNRHSSVDSSAFASMTLLEGIATRSVPFLADLLVSLHNVPARFCFATCLRDFVRSVDGETK